jgi:DNA protecting protein DprA
MSDRLASRPGSATGDVAAAAPDGGCGSETRRYGDSGSDAQRLCRWLAKQAAYDRGLVNRLVKTHGSFAAVVAQPRSALVGALRGGSGSDEAASSASGHPQAADEAVVSWCDAEYPPGLRELFDPPPALFVRGRLWRAMLQGLRLRPTVAIVGARRPSPYGLEMAWLLGCELARAGVNVVSGIALGIDAQAHVGALEGLGAPVADDQARGVPVVLAGVLGSGVRLAVPRTNESLFAAVARRGLLLSEYGWLLPPQPWRFPARNRLIAGLSDAVVIVEGGATSGALHTAAFAADLGRDVLAVPGEAGRPLSAGPHRLLRDGAHLCESSDDVLSLLPEGSWSRPARGGRVPNHGAHDSACGADPESPRAACAEGGAIDGAIDVAADGTDHDGNGPEGRVLAALRRGRHTADQLGRSLNLAPETVSAALTILEIEGLLEVEPGGGYRAVRGARRQPAR